MSCRVSLLFILFMFVLPCTFAQSSAGLEKSVVGGSVYYLYPVGTAEGFYSIGKKFNITQEEIVALNPEAKDGLKQGQVLRIPEKYFSNAVVAVHTPTEVADMKYVNHPIQKGETVYSISKQYGITTDIIYTLNPSAKFGISTGSNLRLPSYALRDSSVQESEYINHVVEPQETLFALSKKYGVNVADILAQNPALYSTTLKTGMVVRIPQGEQTKAATSVLTDASTDRKLPPADTYFYHTVAPKEGLYGISKYYNVPQETIKDLNSSIDFTKLPIGTKIKLPITSSNAKLIDVPKEYMYYTTEKKMSLRKLAKEFNTTEDQLKELNPGYSGGKINKDVVVRVPLQQEWQNASKFSAGSKWLQIADSAEDDTAIIAPEPKSEKLNVIYISVLLPFSLDGHTDAEALKQSSKFVEFYAGILLAADNLEDKGIQVKLKCFDTNKSASSVSKILNDPALKQSNLIIGPAYTSQIAAVSQFAQRNHIMTVIPFSTQSNAVAENPYIIQVNPSSNTYASIASQTLASRITSGNLIIVNPVDDNVETASVNAKAKSFIPLVNSQIEKQKTEGKSTVRIHNLNISGVKTIGDELSLTQDNYILIPTTNEADVSRALPQIRTAISKKNIKLNMHHVTILGFPEWQSYKSIDISTLHELNFTTITTLFPDYSSVNMTDFLKRYRAKYNTEPEAGYPCYGVFGYDLMNFFGSTINKYGKDFQNNLDGAQFEQLGSNFSFKRPSLWGGFINSGALLIQYTPDFDIQVIEKISAK